MEMSPRSTSDRCPSPIKVSIRFVRPVQKSSEAAGVPAITA